MIKDGQLNEAAGKQENTAQLTYWGVACSATIFASIQLKRVSTRSK